MEIDVREVIANIEQYEDWDFKAYPLQKDEADIILKILKGNQIVKDKITDDDI